MARSRRWLVAVTEYAGLTPYTGGIGRHYASLLPALVDLGVEVDLLVFCSEPPVADVDLGGVRVRAYVRRRDGPAVAWMLRRALRLRSHIGRSPYDAVFLAEWEGLGAFLPPGTPLVTNLATSYRLADWIAGTAVKRRAAKARISVAVQSLLETRQMRRSAGLIPISRAVALWNGSRIPDLPPSVVVRNCIDVAAVREKSVDGPLPAGWPDGADPVVVFVGRLERRKGIEAAMRAFAALARARPDVRFVLAGGFGYPEFEPSEADLLSAVGESDRDRFTFLGHLNGDELFPVMRAATVATCPSRWEGFGNVALEVKAVGTPVVVTSGSGFDDFCHDRIDSLMVPPDDSKALEAAIGELLDDEDLRTRLTTGATLTIGSYDAGSVAPDLLDAVERLLAGHGPAEAVPPHRSAIRRRAAGASGEERR